MCALTSHCGRTWEWSRVWWPGYWHDIQQFRSDFAAPMAAQIATDPESLGVRIGLSLLILLVALLLGPRIARSVSRVPALIETVRERRANRVDTANDASGAEAGEASRDEDAPIQQQPTGRVAGWAAWCSSVSGCSRCT